MPPRSSSASVRASKLKRTVKTKTKEKAPLPPPSQWAHLLHPSLLAAATRHMQSIHPDIVGASAVTRPSSLSLHSVLVRYPKSEHACPIRTRPHKRNNASVLVVGKTREALLLAEETDVRFWYRCWHVDCVKQVKARSGAEASSVPFVWDPREGKATVTVSVSVDASGKQDV